MGLLDRQMRKNRSPRKMPKLTIDEEKIMDTVLNPGEKLGETIIYNRVLYTITGVVSHYEWLNKESIKEGYQPLEIFGVFIKDVEEE